MAASEPDITFADVSFDDLAVPLEDEVALGRYRLCYEVGSGGMATVFLARTEGPGRFTKAVALKRIHPHLVKRRDFVSMFLDEARIASLISHPNVCSTFDFGEVDGAYYMAMEYLVGEPLSHVLRMLVQRPGVLASARWTSLAARIAADVCEGLHAAHELCDERGLPLLVVHRDVTPQNVFVTYDGAVKLVDFGVAFARDRLTETVGGTIKGKLAYLAPEQLVPGSTIDRRVDVWALGVTLWEMLTGRRLFARRTDAQTLVAIQTREPPRVSTLRPDIPPELDAIVARALARDPSARHPTARALGRDLLDVVAQAGVAVSMADVSELMAELFTTRRPQKLEALSEVMEPTGVRRRRGTRTLAPSSSVHDARTAVLSSGTEVASGETDSLAAPDGIHSAETMLRPGERDVATSVRARPTAPDRARWPLWLGASLVVATAVVAVGWALHVPTPAGPTRIVDASPTVPLIATPVRSSPPPPVVWQRVPDPPSVPAALPPDPVVRDAPRVAGFGQARFVCGVWADVREHGRLLGRTPTVVRLRAGRHSVEFVASNGRRTTRAFDVTPNGSPVVRCDGP